MNLTEYLRLRGRHPALSRKETLVIGIPYPLPRHWPKHYADVDIPPAAFEAKAASKLSTSEKKKSSRARKAENLLKKDAQKVKLQKWFGVQVSIPEVKVKKIAKPKLPWSGVQIDVTSDSFLQSYDWRRVRMVALKRDGARCACCGATPATGAVMNVDHIKPRKTHPHLALDVNNLQVLCHECNHGKGNWDSTDWR